MDPIDYLSSMFPELDRATIQDVLRAQGSDIDRTIDELLNLAAGDDLFARSVIQEKLTASQHLRSFDTQQERILKECQENKARLAEAQRKKDEEAQKLEALKKRQAEKRAKEDAEKRAKEDAEKRAKEALEQAQSQAAKLEEERQRIEAERLAVRQAHQEMEKLRVTDEQRQKAAADKEALLQQEKEQLEADRRAMAEEKARMEATQQRIAAEEARLEAEKQQLMEANRAPPKLSVYTRKQQAEKGIDQEAVAEQIRALFVANGFVDEEIVTIDVSQDMELASFLKNICKDEEAIQYPLVCAGNLPIGTLEKAQALVANPEQLALLQKGEYVPEFLTEEQRDSLADGTGVFVGQGVLDHCLDAAEYVISGVGSLLWLPVSIVTYPFRSEQPKLEKGEDDVDFDIVHTNWYWRNLKRRFRFSKDGILRIHPTHEDVRASHAYSTISSVKIVSDSSFVINYRDGSSPDYVTATAQASAAMLDLIRTRSASTTAKAPVFIVESEL